MIQNQTIGMRFIHQQMNGKTDALNLLTIKIFVAVFLLFRPDRGNSIDYNH